MSSNPYQPPSEESQTLPEADEPIRFAGGWYAVAGVGLLGGLIAASAFMRIFLSEGAWLAIVSAWLGASYILVWLQKGIRRSSVQKALLTLAGATVGFFLFVFTCSFGSVAAGFGLHGGPNAIPIIISVISFVVVLLLVAKFVHADAVRQQRLRNQNADYENSIKSDEE